MTRHQTAHPGQWAATTAGAVLSALLLLASAHAQVPPTGPYVGLGLGRVHAADVQDGAINQALQGQGLAVRTTGADSNDTGWKLLLGYRFGPHLAVEGGYAQLGRFRFHGQTTSDPGIVDATLKVDDWNLFLVGLLPVSEQWDLFGKLGTGHWRARLSASGSFGGQAAHAASSSGQSAIGGLGAQYRINTLWSARAEWERYRHVGSPTVSGRTDIDFWSVGLHYHF